MKNIEGAILSSFRAGIVAIRADGTVTYVNPIGFTLAVLKNSEGKAGICAFFKDLTQVEMAEESEDLKERLMMLGQMAAGLAHEIRNPIASIGVHASILRSHLSGNEKLLSSVSMMSREIEKVDYIIRECLNFVRPAELDLSQVGLGKLLDGVIARMIALHPGMDISLENEVGGGLKVDGDAALLEQALTNILANAADACHGKGIVTVFVGTSRHFTDAVRLNREVARILPGHSGKEEEFVRIHIVPVSAGGGRRDRPLPVAFAFRGPPARYMLPSGWNSFTRGERTDDRTDRTSGDPDPVHPRASGDGRHGPRGSLRRPDEGAQSSHKAKR